MKIPIHQIEAATDARFIFTGTKEELGLERIQFPIRNLEIDVRLLDADHGYYLTGESTGIAQLHCHRCLADIDFPLEIPLDALVVLDASQEFDLEDDIIKLSGDSQQVEISTLVADMIALEIPAKVLCDKECKGLCAQCGTNLNVKSCDCSTDVIDPRWEKLKELNLEE